MSWKCLISASVLSGYLLWLGVGAVASQASEERTPLIMTKLPPSGSPAYEAIRKRAGEVVVQTLSLTKAEMWSVPKANAEAVTRPPLRMVWRSPPFRPTGTTSSFRCRRPQP